MKWILFARSLSLTAPAGAEKNFLHRASAVMKESLSHFATSAKGLFASGPKMEGFPMASLSISPPGGEGVRSPPQKKNALPS
jgi:hypothetical protein